MALADPVDSGAGVGAERVVGREETMNRRIRGWVLELRQSKAQVVRNVDGRLMISDQAQHSVRPQLWLTPRDVHRLYMKLAVDYRD
mgnify:CR=1 FL=1